MKLTEDTDATNELINDGEAVQPLTIEEIQTLKQSGTHANVRFHLVAFLSMLSFKVDKSIGNHSNAD